MRRSLIISAQALGGKVDQEDGLVIHTFPDGSTFLSLFDGHNGSECMKICMSITQQCCEGDKDTLSANSTFLKILFGKIYDETKKCKSGSTASFVAIDDEDVHTLSIGDSPIIIYTKPEGFITSTCHNVVVNKHDREDARRRGAEYDDGYICDSGHFTQLSRSLGDTHLSRILSHTPSLLRIERAKTSSVVVCSDGFLDPTSPRFNEAVRELRIQIESGASAEGLLQWSEGVYGPTYDNSSVIVWRDTR